MELWSVSHSLLSKMKLLLVLPSVKEVSGMYCFQSCLSVCLCVGGRLPVQSPGSPPPVYRALPTVQGPDHGPHPGRV